MADQSRQASFPIRHLTSPSGPGYIDLQNDTANDPAPVIFGFSQGAVVATEYKKALNANPANTTIPTFVLTGNPNRPNGGVLSRFAGAYVPILDLTANGATPTYTVGAPPGQITTTDIAGEYDPAADFPTNPLNPFSLANAGVGAFVVHLNDLSERRSEHEDLAGRVRRHGVLPHPDLSGPASAIR